MPVKVGDHMRDCLMRDEWPGCVMNKHIIRFMLCNGQKAGVNGGLPRRAADDRAGQVESPQCMLVESVMPGSYDHLNDIDRRMTLKCSNRMGNDRLSANVLILFGQLSASTQA